MSDEWRGSEAQMVSRGKWTRLNGTDTEILLPGVGGRDLVIRARRAQPSDAQVIPLSVPISGPGSYVVAVTEDGEVGSVTRVGE